MKKLSPVRVMDSNEDARSALEAELRVRGQSVVTQLESESLKPAGSNGMFLEIPSDLGLIEPITQYLTNRISKVWLISPNRCTALTIALQEALVNAIKHGNGSDPSKHVRITTIVSDDEANFTVEDEGDGFKESEIPPPGHPDNLYKPSGRGVLMIKSIMDDTHYNGRGNSVTMSIKRTSLDTGKQWDSGPGELKN